MQVVIDIPRETYNRDYRESPYIDIRIHQDKGELKKATICTSVEPYYEEMNVTWLPRGHGRLFDERDIVMGNYEIIGWTIYECEPVLGVDITDAKHEDRD